MAGCCRNLLLAAACVSLPATAAANDCQPREPGTYPWTKYGTVPGDEWARIYLELDKKARVKWCLMGENNIDDSDRRFFVCKAMAEDWRRPASDSEVQAVASTTVEQFFHIRGPDHAKEFRKARKRFFAENPDERPACYPAGP